MLDRKQAVRILNEDKEYEEKMFKALAEIPTADLKKNEMLDENEKEEVVEILKTMTNDTVKHERMIDGLIKYVEGGDKDEF